MTLNDVSILRYMTISDIDTPMYRDNVLEAYKFYPCNDSHIYEWDMHVGSRTEL